MLCLSCSAVKGSLKSYINSSCRVVIIRHNATTQSRTHYETLGVHSKASAREIRSAYLELCKKHHPDANPGDPQAQKKFVQLQEAYNVLNNPKDRADYDVKINRNNFGTRYPRTDGNPFGDDFVRKFYQDQAQARARWQEEEFFDGVKRSREQQKKNEDFIDEMIRKERERRRRAFQAYYYYNEHRNPYDDRRPHYEYHHYHTAGGIHLGLKLFLSLWLLSLLASLIFDTGKKN